MPVAGETKNSLSRIFVLDNMGLKVKCWLKGGYAINREAPVWEEIKIFGTVYIPHFQKGW